MPDASKSRDATHRRAVYEFLATAVRRSGLSVSKLCKKAPVSESNILHFIEKPDVTKIPKPQILQKIAMAAGMPSDKVPGGSARTDGWKDRMAIMLTCGMRPDLRRLGIVLTLGWFAIVGGWVVWDRTPSRSEVRERARDIYYQEKAAAMTPTQMVAHHAMSEQCKRGVEADDSFWKLEEEGLLRDCEIFGVANPMGKRFSTWEEQEIVEMFWTFYAPEFADNLTARDALFVFAPMLIFFPLLRLAQWARYGIG